MQEIECMQWSLSNEHHRTMVCSLNYCVMQCKSLSCHSVNLFLHSMCILMSFLEYLWDAYLISLPLCSTRCCLFCHITSFTLGWRKTGGTFSFDTHISQICTTYYQWTLFTCFKCMLECFFFVRSAHVSIWDPYLILIGNVRCSCVSMEKNEFYFDFSIIIICASRRYTLFAVECNYEEPHHWYWSIAATI